MSLKIICMTDVHANLPALQAALAAIRREGYDAFYHTGDAIAIGPFPDECLDLLLDTPRIHLVMGNHDAYFAGGMPGSETAGMDPGELEHQLWTHSRLTSAHQQAVAGWPYAIQEELEGARTAFVHYALDASGKDFAPVLRDPTPAALDQVFQHSGAELVFYGHHHSFSDLQGRRRYINPGSLGCFTRPLARYAVARFAAGRCSVEYRAIAYEDGPLIRAFEERNVPAAEFIYRAFYGGRFSIEGGEVKREEGEGRREK